MSEGFGPRLRSLRLAHPMTPTELAKAVGLTRQGIYNLETGKSQPSWEVACSLADALKCSLDRFRDPA